MHTHTHTQKHLTKSAAIPNQKQQQSIQQATKRRELLQHCEGHQGEPAVSTSLNGEQLKPSLRPGAGQGRPASVTSVQHNPGILAIAVSYARIRNKGNPNLEKVDLSLRADDMILLCRKL